MLRKEATSLRQPAAAIYMCGIKATADMPPSMNEMGQKLMPVLPGIALYWQRGIFLPPGLQTGHLWAAVAGADNGWQVSVPLTVGRVAR